MEAYYILFKLDYVPGWSSEDKDWQYRLSIYYATKRDTNKFICRNPRGMLNKISVEVTGNEEKVLIIPHWEMPRSNQLVSTPKNSISRSVTR